MKSEVSSRAESLFLFSFLSLTSLIAVLAAFRWGTTIWHYRNFGVDVTDEGYYISSVLFPNKIPHAPTDFAFYLRPLWLLSGQNLANYRVGGFILISSSAAYFSIELARWIHPGTRSLRWALCAILTLVTTAGLAYQYSLWIPTPGYNLLSLCLLTCCASSVMTLARTSRTVNTQIGLIKWSPLATSGLLLFTLFATRITAMVFVSMLFLLVWWLFGYLKNLTKFAAQFSLGVFAGLFIHTALTLRPPWKSAQSWSQSLELSKIRKDHSFKDLWEFDFLKSDVLPWLWWLVAVVGFVLLIRRLVLSDLVRSLIAFSGSLLAVIFMWESRPSGGVRVVEIGVGWWWLRITIYGMLLSFLIPRRLSKENFLGPLIATLALIGAAGSANGIFRQIIFTAGLFMVGLLVQQIVVANQAGWNFRSVVPTSPVFIVFLLLGLSAASDTIETPYRTVGTIWDSTEEVAYGGFGSMVVHPSSAEYARWAAEIKENLPPNIACVVNLEGGTPSFAALIDVPPAGTNWDLGGYLGSAAASDRSLQLDQCWKTNPFLLIAAPTGTRVLPVPNEVIALCEKPFSTFELETDHSASMQALLCNQSED